MPSFGRAPTGRAPHRGVSARQERRPTSAGPPGQNAPSKGALQVRILTAEDVGCRGFQVEPLTAGTADSPVFSVPRRSFSIFGSRTTTSSSHGTQQVGGTFFARHVGGHFTAWSVLRTDDRRAAPSATRGLSARCSFRRPARHQRDGIIPGPPGESDFARLSTKDVIVPKKCAGFGAPLNGGWGRQPISDARLERLTFLFCDS